MNMFICEHTGEVIGSGIPMHRVTVETRPKIYENNVYRNGKKTRHIRVDKGTEIVREIRVGPEAYKQLTGLKPRQAPVRKSFNPPRAKENSKPVRPWSNKDNKNQRTQHKKPIVEIVNSIKQK